MCTQRGNDRRDGGGAGLVIVVTIALSSLLHVGAQTVPPNSIRERDVVVRMRDGVQLRADVLRPS
jgi:predicted acyl esterase